MRSCRLALMPVNSRLSSGELVNILRDADARALLFSDPFLNLFTEVIAAGPLQIAIGLELTKATRGSP